MGFTNVVFSVSINMNYILNLYRQTAHAGLSQAPGRVFEETQNRNSREVLLFSS